MERKERNAEYRRRYSERAFWRKLSGLPRTAGMAVVERAVTLYVVLTDRDTPLWARALVVAALGYFVVPMDAVPDAVPFAGLADDVAVMGAALAQLGRLVTPAVRGRVQRLLPEGLRADAEVEAERPARGKPRKRRSAKHGKTEERAGGGLRGRPGGAGGGAAAGRQPTRVDRVARAERAADGDAEAKGNSETEDKENEET